jgi:bacterioferritin
MFLVSHFALEYDTMTHLALLTSLKLLRTCPREHLVALAVNVGHTADSEAVIKLLNDAMATELVCMLRYRRHHFMARGLHSPGIAQEFLDHANQALGHADQLAARIVQLGGAPDFEPDGMNARSHTEYMEYAEGHNLSRMIRENMLAKRIAIDSYRSLIQYLGNSDPTTSCLLEDILTEQERQGDELAEQLVALHRRRQVTWPSYAAAGDHSLS